MFSKRTGWDRRESALAAAVRGRRADGVEILDLTVSNPTKAGFAIAAEMLLGPLGSAESLLYEPLPFGKSSARAAVAAYYEPRQVIANERDICLTTSTSEAYSYLFRLLCDPGDEVLIASPSYPLFEFLADVDDVRLVSFPLLYEHGWQLQPGAIEACIGQNTKAMVLVHPNNPTGHFVSDHEREALEALCAKHGLALIVDEVFLDYGWAEGERYRSFAEGPHPAMTFVLSGLSKVAGLPQMKLSWIVLAGPEQGRAEARERLEVIADAYLSVSAPVQAALPAWLAASGAAQRQILERVRANLASLDGALSKGVSAVSRLAAEGGWYAVLRVPAVMDDEQFAERLLQVTGVLVHPGSGFGFGEKGWIVVSLLQQKDQFVRAFEAFLGFVDKFSE